MAAFSLLLDLLVAIRAHWRIETTSHDSRDVTFGEDRSRICTNLGMLARLRSFGFNILTARCANTLARTATEPRSPGSIICCPARAIPGR